MRINRLVKFSILISGFSIIFGVQAFAQPTQNPPTRVNFGYSQNPKTKSKQENNPATSSPQLNVQPSDSTVQKPQNENRSIAKKTLEIAKRANSKSLPPTEIYKVGAGDILFISLQNAPAKATNYFTVLNDGTIDYPLAGEMVSVLGFTTEEIEDLLREKIKLYENPQVLVKLREYASHSITVLGLVEKPGEKFLQREAIPLYVVRAEAIVSPNATGIMIKRTNSQTEKFNLNDSKYEDVLVFPGDMIEFTSDKSSQTAPFYYIGGNISSPGQKDFYNGITLTQAILVSGGVRKTEAKRVYIRRKNEQGMLVLSEYNLKEIRNGKSPDPALQAGDTIEIGN
jgi:polysaccharide export outer membrane protein